MNPTLREAGESVRDYVTNLIRRIRRTQPGPALLRVVVGLAAAVALLTAAPTSVVSSRQVGLLVPFAVGVALFPRTRFVMVTATVTLLLWLLTTIADDAAPPLWRIGLLAASLYVMHSAAAVAAVLPYDAAVSREVVLRWGRRVTGVTAASVAIGLAGMAVLGQLPTQRSIVGPMVGAVLAAVLVGVLALQQRRR